MSWSAPASRSRKRDLPERSPARRRRTPTERSSLERWLEAGLKLDAVAGTDAFESALVDEAAALSGADRVLLTLASTADGNGGRAGSISAAHLPPGENAAELLQAIAPWIDDARRTGAAQLHHGPQGADAREQRSCVVAPLIGLDHRPARMM